MVARLRMVAVLGGLGALSWSAGCSEALSLLNPEFLTALGAGEQVASVPGDAPALLVAVENRTNRLVRAWVSYRTEDSGVEQVGYLVETGERTAQALICPIDEVTLGDVSDVTAIGAEIVLDNSAGQEAIAPFIEVEPFGVVMKDGINYNCGDSITFVVQASGATRSGYQIFAFIERSGGGEG